MKSKATFGAGCFWGIESVFRDSDGVLDTEVGYAGGDSPDTSYEEVCTGTTGHAEVVQVEFDDSLISYTELLDIFWKNHDPTTRNRQGPDVGSQYRAVIFFHDANQESQAQRLMVELDNAKVYRSPIVTELLPYTNYFRAEEYHQQYLAKRGMGHCGL